MRDEIRKKPLQGLLERGSIICADPQTIGSGNKDVVWCAGFAVHALNGFGLGQVKRQAGETPSGSAILALHQTNRVGAAKVTITCGGEKLQCVCRMKSHVGHAHAGPVGFANQRPLVTRVTALPNATTGSASHPPRSV